MLLFGPRFHAFIAWLFVHPVAVLSRLIWRRCETGELAVAFDVWFQNQPLRLALRPERQLKKSLFTLTALNSNC